VKSPVNNSYAVTIRKSAYDDRIMLGLYRAFMKVARWYGRLVTSAVAGLIAALTSTFSKPPNRAPLNRSLREITSEPKSVCATLLFGPNGETDGGVLQRVVISGGIDVGPMCSGSVLVRVM